MGRAGRGKIQRVLIAFTAVASLSMGTVACSSSSSAVPTLGLYLYPDHSGATDQAITNCNQQSNGAYKIQYHQLPSAADGQRLQLVKRLAAKDHALDIVGMDVVWAPEFAEAGWI